MTWPKDSNIQRARNKGTLSAHTYIIKTTQATAFYAQHTTHRSRSRHAWNSILAAAAPTKTMHQCNSVQSNAIQCNPMQFNAIQCNSMRPNVIRCDSMQFNKIQCNSMQLNGIQRSVPRLGSSQRFKVCSASRFVAAFECNPMLLHAINVIQWNSMQFKGLFLVAVRRSVPRSVPRRGSSQRGKVCFSSRFVATLQGLFLVAVRRSVSI